MLCFRWLLIDNLIAHILSAYIQHTTSTHPLTQIRTPPLTMYLKYPPTLDVTHPNIPSNTTISLSVKQSARSMLTGQPPSLSLPAATKTPLSTNTSQQQQQQVSRYHNATYQYSLVSHAINKCCHHPLLTHPIYHYLSTTTDTTIGTWNG